MAKTTKKHDPKTYAAKTPDGRTVRCTVPESDNREWSDLLVEAIRETLSPEAVVSIAAHLQAARTNDPKTDQQVGWFANLLATMVGPDEYSRICRELGL